MMISRKNILAGLAWGTLVVLPVFFSTAVLAADDNTVTTQNDPHYTPAGFFDLHVCNWPGRPLFFLTVFSTTRFREVEKIEVFLPDGKTLGTVGLQQFLVLKRKNKPEKRVFLSHIDVPRERPEGWYSARVILKNGEQYVTRDFVVIESMQRVSGLKPQSGAENIPMPDKLSWNSVPGATHYQVYIRDRWNGDALIHTSKLLNKPELILPANLLEVGGWYTWRVHARDVNENILLGDFNHGSLTAAAEFSTTEK